MKRLARAGLAAMLLAAGAAEGETTGAQAVFDAYADRVVQIEVVDRASGTKASIGSGFAVGGEATRDVITNFHVIAEVLHEPERYRAELLTRDGDRHPIEVLAVDVISDLAWVRSEWSAAQGLAIRSGSVSKGERLYALGNPYDLGLSIVEGTYNGLLEHSIDHKIHFTGSLNPGMSGGPAVDERGDLVGVNVATSGNQISFLVPGSAVAALRARPPASDAAALVGSIRDQLYAYQQRYTEAILTEPAQRVSLGPASAGTRPATFFNCWGDTQREAELLYVARSHECSTDDSVYLSKRLSVQPVTLRHRALESRALSPGRFFAIYSQFFEGNHSEMWGSEEDFTAFRCRTRFVRDRDLTFKTAFCARRYLAYDGLYDVVFKAALLGRERAGVESALVLSAISVDNASRLAARHLEGIAWNE